LLILLALPPLGGLGYFSAQRGFVRFNYPSRQEFPVWGVDVSRHQGKIDWSQVAAAKIDFVYIKASEGGDWTDPRFDENWRGAKAAGLPFGAYHYFTFCRPGAEQAAHFISALPRDQQMLPLVVDVEFGGNCKSAPAASEIRRELHAMVDLLTKHFGRAPMLYLTEDADQALIAGDFSGAPRWIRSVFWSADPASPWIVWQFTNRARVAGFEDPVDLNVFRGALADLKAQLRMSPP